MKAQSERTDRFAEYLAQGRTVPEIRRLMKLTAGQAQGMMSRIRHALGWQAI